MKILTVKPRYFVTTYIVNTSYYCVVYHSRERKSIMDAIEEAKEGNVKAFLGLTDSIIAIIKYYPVAMFSAGSLQEKALNKVIVDDTCRV